MRSLVSSLVSLIVLGTLGGTLASATQNPTPFVNQPLIPASVAPGGAAFTLTVNGTGFVSGSVVNWNGSPRATTFVSGSQLGASILSSDIAAANTGSVTVSSPTPGGAVSNVVFLPVREPATFVSLNSTSFGIGATAFATAVADFNKDGKQDMALLIEGLSPALWILLGNGDGTLSQGSKYSLSGTAADSVYAADLNNDGNLDLILPDEDRGLIILLGKGDGTFQQFVDYPAPQQIINWLPRQARRPD